MTRRDLCHLAGHRAARLTPQQAARAWLSLSQSLQDLGERDVPKFRDVLQAVRLATIVGKIEGPDTEQEDWRAQQDAFNRLQDEYTAFRNAAFKVTTEKTIEHFIQEQRCHVTPGWGV